MEKTELYVKYLNNVAVPVDTSYGRGPQGTLPLVTVAHLVAAYKTAVAPLLDTSSLGQLTLHSFNNGVETIYNSWDPLTVLGENGRLGTNPLIIKSKNDARQGIVHVLTLGINDFLLNTLADIENDLSNPTTTGTRRKYPKTPNCTGRWEEFKADAAAYVYPTTPIGNDISLPFTSEIKFSLEKDVNKVIGNHLDNFNRIFRDQGKTYRFKSKANVFRSNPETGIQLENSIKFIGVPDNVLSLDSRVLTFVECKTPNDLPVRHSESGELFDLLDMYREDMQYQQSERIRYGMGRMDVCTVIDHVYGYLALNNLMYGCVTCYDATYFLWRPKKSTLLISHPIYNNSQSPTLLQALYYFVHVVLRDDGKQTEEPSPIDSDIPLTVIEDMNSDEHIPEEPSDSGSNYSTTEHRNEKSVNVTKNKRAKHTLNIDSLRSGTVIGFGATGQVIRLKESNIVVKHCDSYNNSEGFEMLKNEIEVYEKLSLHNLGYVPRYYGECEFFGQHFILMDYIPGKHCDWRKTPELTAKLNHIIQDLNSIGVVHRDLRPENVLLTRDGEIKLIDFGKAEIKERFSRKRLKGLF
jgi:predicted Ser/Thr protein kinase